VMALAQRAGLADLVAEHVRPGGAPPTDYLESFSGCLLCS
jgi:hypothetical protein